jgi:DNA-binding transcriptional ArsR family regulator
MEPNTPAAPVDLSEELAVRSLAAIAQPHRLRVFRALVVAGEAGLTPGALAELLNVAPSSLSFHLKELTYSGLASAEARGRNLIYRANFAQMNGLLAYLTQHCCQGQACEAAEDCVAC